MNCPRCGNPIQPGSAFCSRCGNAVAPNRTGQMPAPQPVPQPVPMPAAAAFAAQPLAGAFEQQRKRNLLIAGVLICLAAVLAGGLAMKSGIFGANDKGPNDPTLLARANGPANTLVAPASSNNSPMVAPAKAPAEMPDDIYKWLEHLRKTEEKRVDITLGQLTTAYTEKEKSQLAGGVDALKDALNGIDDPNSELHSPTDKLAGIVKQMHDDVTDLKGFFDSYPNVPAECVPIKDAYDQALSETAAQMGDIADHLAAGDVDKLLKMEGKSASGIDSSGEKTDRLVGEICSKYNKRRWFSIASDIKSSPLFGSGF